MNAIHPTADVDQVLAPAERTSPAASAPPHIDRDTCEATRGITAGVLLGAGLWAIVIAIAWLIFG
ncbi:MAG TPA: hypothetical protein VI653_25190 [Steroidobacteraceae bacterium]